MKQADWAQFRELVTGMGEEELAAFVRDYAVVHRPVDIGEEEFAVILRDHAAFLRNGRPPALSESPPPFRGVLAKSDDEFTTFIRDNKIKFPVLTPEDKAEAAWETRLFEAIERGEIGREKPGRKTGRSEKRDAKYLAFAEKCRNEAGANIGLARTKFLDGAGKELGITPETAADRWPSLRKKIFTESR